MAERGPRDPFHLDFTVTYHSSAMTHSVWKRDELETHMFRGQITLFKTVQLETSCRHPLEYPCSLSQAASAPSKPSLLGALGYAFGFIFDYTSSEASHESCRVEPPPFTQQFNEKSQRMAGEHTHSHPHSGETEHTFPECLNILFFTGRYVLW